MQVEQIKEMLVDAEKLLNILNDLKNMELSNATFVPTSLEDKLLKIKECAKRMQTSEITVREYIRSGKLPALKIGDLKVRESTLVKFMAEQEAEYMQNEEFKKIG
jgi:excisionase family DNA binding protein